MSSNRFFLDTAIPEGSRPVRAPLSPADLHHAKDVLRLGQGDEIVLVEPDGRVWHALVVEAGPDGLLVEPGEPAEGVSPYRVTLVQGIAKGSKVDLVIEKVTELNVEAVMPVFTERSVVRLDDEKRRARGERWRRVAHAAAKQSQRSTVPRVADPVALREALDTLSGFDVVLVVWEGASATGPGIGEALDEAGATAASRVALVVGPEGGLTAEEVYALEDAGARAVTLGETVLRSETAGMIAVALCVYELGGLGGRPRD